MNKKDIIIYPIFLDCCKFTTDTFWENIFEDLAYAKTPYGTYISKHFLCCSYKNKEFSYKIENKDPEKLYNDVYNLLTKKFGLMSHKEKIKKKLDFYNIEEELKESRKTWANIRKKNIKDLLIESYVINMKNQFQLSLKQAKDLLSTIFIAMVFKVIISKDIHYENGKIESIDGIEIKKKQVILNRDIYNIENCVNSCIIVEPNFLSDNWEKYLLSLKKLI